MVSTENIVWIATRVGIPFLALLIIVGTIVAYIQLNPKKNTKRRKKSNPLMSATRVIPFYSSVIEEKRPKSKHLRSHSAQLTPPSKYLRQSPCHKHIRRNSSPTMSPHSTRRESTGESIDSTNPKIAKLLEAFSLFPIQPPSNWNVASGKRHSESSIKSRHLTPKVGILGNLTTTRLPSSPPASQKTTACTHSEEKQ